MRAYRALWSIWEITIILFRGRASNMQQLRRTFAVIESVLFPGFLVEDISTTGATIRTLRAGSGPPLLLLHGYPQTHVIWHKIARHLTDRFTVVLTDLRGYGDSSKPEGGTRHVNYSFRAMAQDQLEVMRHLGYERFTWVLTTEVPEQLTDCA